MQTLWLSASHFDDAHFDLRDRIIHDLALNAYAVHALCDLCLRVFISAYPMCHLWAAESSVFSQTDAASASRCSF